MCGVAGYIGIPSNLQLARRLLAKAESRGRDATGYVEINGTDGRYALRKQAIPARQFVDTLKFQFRGANHTFLGHCRAATTGTPEATNQAHPFVGSRFIVFHNGTICEFDRQKLQETFNIQSANGVDSELFLAFLEQKGSVDALRTEFLPLLTNGSAYALVIFDKVSKTIHFLRCNGRPLAIGRLDDGGLVYASTPKIMQAAVGKLHVIVELLQPYMHLEISSFSGEILRKCAIRPSKASLDYSDAVGYINRYRKPIRFF